MPTTQPPPGPARPRARVTLARKLRKDRALRSLLLALAASRLMRPLAGRRRLEVECYPGVPHHRHMLWKVAFYAGLRFVPCDTPRADGPVRERLRLFWPDAAGVPPGASWPRTPPPGGSPGLNAGLRDASKRAVARAFADVFGHPLAVDPTAHAGPCVAKSDRLNAAHDGRVLHCPLPEADPALAYELLVDNSAGNGTVLDYRVPVLGGEIPFVYVKRRPLGTRFANENLAVTVAAAGEVLSGAERERIADFCRAMALDVGELDVLRDAPSGRIYVVDVNRTPWGPPRPLRLADAVRAVRAYADAFARLAERVSAAPREAVDSRAARELSGVGGSAAPRREGREGYAAAGRRVP